MTIITMSHTAHDGTTSWTDTGNGDGAGVGNGGWATGVARVGASTFGEGEAGGGGAGAGAVVKAPVALQALKLAGLLALIFQKYAVPGDR